MSQLDSDEQMSEDLTEEQVKSFPLEDTAKSRIAMAALKVTWAKQEFEKVVRDEFAREALAHATAERLLEGKIEWDEDSVTAWLVRLGAIKENIPSYLKESIENTTLI